MDEVVKPKKKRLYSDPKRLLEEMLQYRKQVLKSKKDGTPKPKVPDYVGEVILNIAVHISSKPNYASYIFKEDMIGDAVINVLTYIDNWTPRKSKNVFAYFTQIIKWAFWRRIAAEKKEMVKKYKAIQNSPIFQDLVQQVGDEGQYQNGGIKYILKNMGDVVVEFEAKEKEKKAKLKEKKKSNLAKML